MDKNHLHLLSDSNVVNLRRRYYLNTYHSHAETQKIGHRVLGAAFGRAKNFVVKKDVNFGTE